MVGLVRYMRALGTLNIGRARPAQYVPALRVLHQGMQAVYRRMLALHRPDGARAARTAVVQTRALAQPEFSRAQLVQTFEVEVSGFVAQLK